MHTKYLNKNWILLDNQSTVHIFHNKDLVSHIHPVPKNQRLICHSNGGSQLSTNQATFGQFGHVWFNESSIANILSFAKVRKSTNFEIEYLSKKNVFVVTTPTGDIMPFIQSPRGLYFYDIRWKPEKCSDYVFVNTVQDNMNLFTPRQVAKAEKARELYIQLGRPSAKSLRYMIAHQLVKNTTLDVTDVDRADQIFGPDLGALKGKTVSSSPAPVVTLPSLAVPRPIFELHKHVTLSVDIFYVDKMMFFFTYSHHIQFKKVQYIATKKHDCLFLCFQNVVNIYRKRGFLVSHIRSDY